MSAQAPVSSNGELEQKVLKPVPIEDLIKSGLVNEADLSKLVDQKVTAAMIDFRLELGELEQGSKVEFAWEETDHYLYRRRKTESSGKTANLEEIANAIGASVSTVEAAGINAEDLAEDVVRDLKPWRKLKEVSEAQQVFNSATRTLNLGELRLYQDAAVHKRHRDPHAASIVKNTANYVIGRGLVIKCAHPVPQAHIAKFNEDNDMAIEARNMVADCYTEGELFNALFASTRTGRVRRRSVPTREVVEIECHPEDATVPVAYKRMRNLFGPRPSAEFEWWADIGYEAQKDDELDGVTSDHDNELSEVETILHMKYGSDLRGRLPMEPILKWLQIYEGWITDRARLNHERSKVLFIKKIKNRSGETIARYQRPPKGGVTLIATENLEWDILESKIQAGDAKDDGLSLLYMIGSGVCYPIHILDQRADQEVYASIKKAETPFSNMIAAEQEFYRFYFTKMYRWVLKMGVKYGKLPKKVKVRRFTTEIESEAMERLLEGVRKVGYSKALKEVVDDFLGDPDIVDQMKEVSIPTEEVEINFIFPEIVREDPLDLAREIFLLEQTALFSRTTLAALRGFDYIEEQFMRRKEPAPHMPPQQGGFPGGSDTDGSGAPSTNPGSSDNPGTKKGTDPGRDSELEKGAGEGQQKCPTCTAPI